MPNTLWSRLDHPAFCHWAKQYAKMVFASYGFLAEDMRLPDEAHFIASYPIYSLTYRVKVQAHRRGETRDFPLGTHESPADLLICYLDCSDGRFPEVFLLPMEECSLLPARKNALPPVSYSIGNVLSGLVLERECGLCDTCGVIEF